MKLFFDDDLTFERFCKEAIETAENAPWDLQDWFDSFLDDFTKPVIELGDLTLDTRNKLAINNVTFETSALCPEFWRELQEIIDFWKEFDE